MGIIEANRYYSCDAAAQLPRRDAQESEMPKARPARSVSPVTTSHDLKSAGLKATVPRLKIINLFETSTVRHLSAEDVYKMLLTEGLDIGLATVYRVLTQFEQAGLLVRHHFESGKAVFELNEGKHHDHLVCMQCGRVEEFYDAEIEKRQTRIAKERGFVISEHALYLYADCTKPRCPYRNKLGGPN
jgi:Fur family ferric uptake transcriptional regulator